MWRDAAQRTLFSPFRGIEYINHGGYGHVFRLVADHAIVVKIAHRVVGNTTAGEDARAAEAQEILQRERTFYEALAAKKPPHPNIVEYFLSTDIAIFMKFEPDTLERRLSRRFETPIAEEQQFRWIKEMASAASWLESLDYFHGDLWPDNILLDEAEHVKVCDFGWAQKRGCKVDVATCPFYRPAKHAVAGPAHEQFAIGSCIYTIRTGEMPYGEWETPEDYKTMYGALIQGQYPSTEDDRVLGHVVSSCWHASYDSMADVEAAVEHALKVSGVILCGKQSAAPLSVEEHDGYVRKCREFLAQQGGVGQGQ
ncbi:kinase-like domain-containing protein [Cercophora scortea]|uniref:Kinase-like domain-containing protein n=1 Tax=Cercophora scortea TaxID=314031 RepID=A0AAE0IG09_9PEZI|nr:kinase-like domain-containing protein [Cercophora scortea]